MSPNIKVELIESPCLGLGEGPHWDDETQNLYYVDIRNGVVLRYNIDENKIYSAKVDNEQYVSFIVPVEGSTTEFVVGISRRLGVISWDGISETCKVVRILGEVEFELKHKNNRFNDGKCDRFGRIYCGTMRMEPDGSIVSSQMGNLYLFNKELNNFQKLYQNVSISNGLCWNSELNKFYYVDSCTFDVKEFDYDPKSGLISNEQTLIEFQINGSDPGFFPDGMTIDAEGFLYLATWGSSKILKINPKTGKVDLEIEFPVKRITSAAFGGKDLDTLFVTTAVGLGSTEHPYPAGCLFKVTGLNAKGTKMNRAKI